jgi:hypothetical protein
VEDCGVLLGDSSVSPSALLSVVRAKELAQTKIAEAIERAATKEVAKAAEDSKTHPQLTPTSVVVSPQSSP